MAFPAWFASNTHDPTAWKLTTPAEIEHTDEDDASTVIAGVNPDVDDAVGVYVAPPTVAALGAVDENDTDCDAGLTTNPFVTPTYDTK